MVNTEFEVRRPILVGDTANVYLLRTLTILRNESMNPVVTMEFAAREAGIFCGIAEARALLGRVLPETGSEVWVLDEGEDVAAGEVALRVKAPYGSIGLYETAISGILASGTGWATAAHACVDAAGAGPRLSRSGRATSTRTWRQIWTMQPQSAAAFHAPQFTEQSSPASLPWARCLTTCRSSWATP